MKDLWKSETNIKLKSNLYMGPVIFFFNCWHYQILKEASEYMFVLQ